MEDTSTADWETEEKLRRIRALLERMSLDALVLRKVSSFAWATGGASSYVNIAADLGEGALLVTRDRRFLLANNIEAPRFIEEEKLADKGWEPRSSPWNEPSDILTTLTRSLRLGADGCFLPGAVDVSAELARLRAALLPTEVERMREVSRSCADAMHAAILQSRPGSSELALAALVAKETLARGVLPIVNLVAVDDRTALFRHALPTEKRLERYASFGLCGRKHGLVCSISRAVHFGPVPAELERRSRAVAHVDAAILAATRPEIPLRQVFERAVAAYAEAGFPGEWTQHHQGGAAGYEPREYLATADSEDRVSLDHAYAFNPTIRGTKSEDTILVTKEAHEVLTSIAGWPLHEVEIEGRKIVRPSILRRD